MCCLSATCVGGMFSRLLDFCVNNHLASLTFRRSLVWSCNSTTNRSDNDMQGQITDAVFHTHKVSNASVTSGNTFQTLQAVYFPHPSNAETVTHPANAWKTGTLSDPIPWQLHELVYTWYVIYFQMLTTAYLTTHGNCQDYNIYIYCTYGQFSVSFLHSISCRHVSTSSCEQGESSVISESFMLNTIFPLIT